MAGDTTMHDGYDCAVMDTADWSHCWIHHADEKVPRNVYRICFECGHVWTRWTLWRAHAKELRKMKFKWHRLFGRYLWTPPKRIYFCQVCIHDF